MRFQMSKINIIRCP